MKREIDVKASSKEMAEMLFELDSKEIGEVLSEWNRLIKAKRQEDYKNGNINMWSDLGDVFMWAANHVDEDLDIHDCIRAMYASSISTLGICDFDQIYKP